MFTIPGSQVDSYVTIGGVPASVTAAALVDAGLYQISVTVPNVPAGDQEVMAKIGDVSSPSGVLLKIAG